jgi:hypothetical protein
MPGSGARAGSCRWVWAAHIPESKKVLKINKKQNETMKAFGWHREPA